MARKGVWSCVYMYVCVWGWGWHRVGGCNVQPRSQLRTNPAEKSALLSSHLPLPSCVTKPQPSEWGYPLTISHPTPTPSPPPQVNPAKPASKGDIAVFCMEPSLHNFANLVLTRDAFFGKAAPPNVQW